MKLENYTLYIGNNCCSCDKIEHFISDNSINIPSVNIDEEEYTLPFSLMIIPALTKNKKLIAYGPDIIPHLKDLTG